MTLGIFNPLNWGSDDKDSTHERHVEERCDHEYDQWHNLENAETWPVLKPNPQYHSPRIEHGHLTFDIIVEKERFCIHCGDRQARMVFDGRAAIKLDYRLDEGRSVGDVITERVGGHEDEQDADTTLIEGEPDEPGRVIVNENPDTGVFVDEDNEGDDE